MSEIDNNKEESLFLSSLLTGKSYNNKMLETPSGQVSYGDQQLTLKGALHHEEFGQVHLTQDGSQQLSLEGLDSVVTSVMQKYIERSLVGKKKYGTTLDREDLTIVEWINHTQEELMDATLYLEKLKKTLVEKGLKVFLSNEVK